MVAGGPQKMPDDRGPRGEYGARRMSEGMYG